MGVNRQKGGVGGSVFLLSRKRKGRLRGDRGRSFDRDALKKMPFVASSKPFLGVVIPFSFFYFTFVTWLSILSGNEGERG